jgi:transposase-like protein
MRTRISAAEWAELVATWQASGQAATKFAAEHGIAEASLRWWKTELTRRGRNEPARRSPGPGRLRRSGVKLARVVREGEVEASATTSDEPTRHVSIVIGRARIQVEHGFDGQLLREVVRALEAAR